MPQQHIDAEIFLVHRGVTVFHTYNDSDHIDDRLDYWYSFDASGEGEDFDVRDLPNPDNLDSHADIIVNAIENGDIEITGDYELDDDNPYALTEGQKVILTSIGIENPTHTDQLPDPEYANPIVMALLEYAKQCSTKEELLAKRQEIESKIAKDIESAFAAL